MCHLSRNALLGLVLLAFGCGTKEGSREKEPYFDLVSKFSSATVHSASPSLEPVARPGDSLLFLPAGTRSAWLDKCELSRFTERTITSRDELEVDLEAVRGRGYATCDRENVEYVNGIAAPIFNYMGEPIAALNIWALTFRKPLGDLLEWAEELKSSAHRISTMIGGEEGAGADGDGRTAVGGKH